MALGLHQALFIIINSWFVFLTEKKKNEKQNSCEADSLISNKLQVALEDPKRFRIELTFSRGADLSPLEVM